MKRILSILMSVALIVTMIPLSSIVVNAATYGTTGECSWSVSGSTLTISGTGAMGSYTDFPVRDQAPWGHSITSVIINEGVTNIGAYAFYDADKLVSVSLPKSLTSIGYGAFYGCTSLVSIDIPKNVDTIGTTAFYNCIKLSEINLKNSAIQIYKNAFFNTSFYNNASNWNEGLLYIGKHLIKAQTDVSGEILLSEGTLDIAASAFESCTQLTSLTMPNSVEFICNEAFKSCTFLSEVTFSENIKEIQYSAFSDCLCLNNVVLPSNVTYISSWAFNNCSGMTRLVLPEQLNKIDEYAFLNCTSLRELTIPGSVQEIGYGAFSQCCGLTKLVIEEGVPQIPQRGFYHCENLRDVVLPKSLTTIGYESFRASDNIKHILYKGSNDEWLSSIGSSANLYHASLAAESVHLNATGNEIQYLDTDTCSIHWVSYCSVCDKYTTELIKPFNHVYIENVCEKCGLDDGWDYSLSDSEITITGYTGEHKDVVIPSSIENLPVVAIAGNTFKNNTLIENVVIPNNIKTIGGSAFYGCSSLKEVSIGNGVVEIGISAFDSCTSLGSVVIPNSVTSIGKYAFYGCTALESITIPFVGGTAEANRHFGYIFGASKYSQNADYVPASLKYLTISEGCTSIYEHAFDGCGSIVSVVIPKTMTSIGYYAFNGCSSIAHRFYGCTDDEWSNISFGSGNDNLRYGIRHCETSEHLFTYIGEDKCTVHIVGFCSVCDEYTTKQISDGSHSFDSNGICSKCSVLNTWQYSISYGKATIESYTGTEKNIVIPQTIEGVPVTVIGQDAFRGNGTIESVVIPEGVTYIGYYAFYNCLNLKETTIPSTVTGIGYDAFYNCQSLKNVNILDLSAWCTIQHAGGKSNPIYYTESFNLNGKKVTDLIIPDDVIKIEESAFAGYKALISVEIPATVEYIYRYAFSNCESLLSVSIADGVTEIRTGAFSSCTNLSEITLPNSIEVIGESAFYGTAYYNDSSNWEDGLIYIGNHLIHSDTNIEGNIQIKPGTVTIADKVFYRHYDIENIVIPEGLKHIGSDAFESCNSLKNIYIPSSVETIPVSSFDYCPSSLIIYCYANTKAHTFAAYNGFTYKFICDEHDWQEATCTTVKTCSACGITEGSFMEHSYDDAYDPVCNKCGAERLIEIENKMIGATGECAWMLDGNVLTIYGNGNMADYSSWGNLAPWQDKSITTVIICDGVINIGKYAFDQCDTLTSVTIPNSVTSIGSSAFDSCTSLTNITIPNGVTEIGGAAFYFCDSLTSVTLSNSVTVIGYSAFNTCRALKTVWYTGSVADRGNISIDGNNNPITRATWHYNTCENGHTYSGDCDKLCENCDWERSGDLNHTYSNACDKDCDICGNTRDVADHIYDHGCDYSCNECGATRTIGAHVYSNDADTTCNECGKTRVVENAPTFVVESKTATAGKTFTVAVSTKNNSGIVSLKLNIGYDAEVLELISIEEADFADTSFSAVGKNPITVLWEDVLSDNNTTNGTVALLTFKVKDTAKACDTEITITYDPEDVYDYDMNNVDFAVENGTITVIEYISGDVNGDGNVNNKDYGILRQYLNNWEVNIDECAADVNRDGAVNNKDLGILRRYLNNWDVVLK